VTDPAAPRRADFWLYFGGQVISTVGSAFTMFALPLLVYKLTGSPTDLALTMAANMLPYLFFGLAFGAIADRVDRRRMMIWVDVSRAAVIAVLPLLYLAGSLDVTWVYLVAFVQASLGILFDSGEFAAIPSLVPRSDLVTANGRIMAATSAGQVAGPVLAGALVSFLAPASLLFVDAATFAVSALTLVLIRRSFNAADEPDDDTPPVDGASVVRRLARDVREGLGYVWRHPVLRSISIMMALINFFAATTLAQLAFFTKTALHASDSQVGWMFAAGAAGVVVVGSIAGPLRRRLSFPVVALGALIVSGLALVGMGLTHSYPVAIVLWAISSGFAMLLNINTAALRQAIVPNRLLGRVMSVASVLAWSAIPAGALAGAAVMQATDVSVVYAAIGAIDAVIAATFWLSPIRHGEQYLANAAA
jgi:MFS family permease